jgi:Dyp-type peroxidase family
MDPGSVTAASQSRSWRLKGKEAEQAQGLIVSPFADLPDAEALFLRLPDKAGGAWLKALREHVKISDATGPTPSAAAIAFTCTGLAAMGLEPEILATFSAPFREGMHQADRRRRLGDDNAEAIIPGGPRWSGNTPDADPDPDDTTSAASTVASTPITVHAVLLLYAASDGALDQDVTRAESALHDAGVDIVHRRRLSRLPAKGVAREHFGFADGMSQPVPKGEPVIPPIGPEAEQQLHWHGVALGEILIGHGNAHGEDAPGPLVSEQSMAAPKLPPSGTEGFRDLGLNGSYLVIRELRQDVAAFWNSMDAAAAAIGDPKITAVWVAERVIGRTRNGDALSPGGPLPRVGGSIANNFGFAEKDLHGRGCPLGSHIRRANPRDSLPSRDGPSAHLFESVQNHRILRRGRKYGPEITDTRSDDGCDRGLLFMCLNTDLVRHFEFVQQTWLLNRGFATLFDETDPLMGPKGRFTIPNDPLRYCVEVQTFIRFAGGEYFFLPSIPALDFLENRGP